VARQDGRQLVREVNDRIYEVLADSGSEDGDFLCECEDRTCAETVQLTLREYAVLQKGEFGAVVAPAHSRSGRFPPSLAP
jgi:hypothetical protein